MTQLTARSHPACILGFAPGGIAKAGKRRPPPRSTSASACVSARAKSCAMRVWLVRPGGHAVAGQCGRWPPDRAGFARRWPDRPASGGGRSGCGRGRRRPRPADRPLRSDAPVPPSARRSSAGAAGVAGRLRRGPAAPRPRKRGPHRRSMRPIEQRHCLRVDPRPANRPGWRGRRGPEGPVPRAPGWRRSAVSRSCTRSGPGRPAPACAAAA